MTDNIQPAVSETPIRETHEYALDFANIASFDFAALPSSTPVRLFIRHRRMTIPLSLVIREDQSSGASKGLVILTNGAVDLARSKSSPVFQRFSWWPEIPASVLSLCDPGTIGPDALSLAWSHDRPQKWATPAMSEIVRTIANALGPIPSSNRTYFGSSAGGHLALQLSIRDAGSRAVVNNCQFDWTRWMDRAVKAVCLERFSGMTPEEIRDLFPNDVSPLNSIREFDIRPRLDYLVNLSSSHDRDVDLPQMIDLMDTHPELVQNISVHAYRDPAKRHNPVDKPIVLGMLGSATESEAASNALSATKVVPALQGAANAVRTLSTLRESPDNQVA